MTISSLDEARTAIADCLSYQAETGVLVWTKQLSLRGPVGREAGSVAPNGYRYVGVRGKRYLAHRLAWLLHYGRWPEKGLDHINGNPLDNRIVNLRAANQSENSRNRGPQTNNKSGIKGVHWSTAREKWVAAIQHRSRMIALGRFDSKADAAAAYRRAALQVHGNFARLDYDIFS